MVFLKKYGAYGIPICLLLVSLLPLAGRVINIGVAAVSATAK